MKAEELIETLDSAAEGKHLSSERRVLLTRIARVLDRTKMWELEYLFAALSKLKAPPLPGPPRGPVWYGRKLNEAYLKDAEFEQLISEMRTDRSITRDDAIALYRSLFESDREFATRYSKPKLVDEIRRERLARIRLR
jgi:hypothetical protein